MFLCWDVFNCISWLKITAPSESSDIINSIRIIFIKVILMIKIGFITTGSNNMPLVGNECGFIKIFNIKKYVIINFQNSIQCFKNFNCNRAVEKQISMLLEIHQQFQNTFLEFCTYRRNKVSRQDLQKQICHAYLDSYTNQGRMKHKKNLIKTL